MDAQESGSAVRRLAVHFTGQVQGVGFRWSSQRIANNLGLTGWVHNEWDGSVKMELQGTNDDISVFFGMLNSMYKRYHLDYRIEDQEDIPLVEGEAAFRVI